MSAATITYFPHAGITLATHPDGFCVATGRNGCVRVEPSDYRTAAPTEPASPAPVAHRLRALPMPSLGTQFGPRVAGQATMLSLADTVPVFAHAQTPPETPLAQTPEKDDSPYLPPPEAAQYLRISDSTFRKVARWIKCQPGNGCYRREDLDAYAQGKKLKEKRPRRKGKDKKAK